MGLIVLVNVPFFRCFDQFYEDTSNNKLIVMTFKNLFPYVCFSSRLLIPTALNLHEVTSNFRIV
jgi:hypothetical protein